MSSSIRDHARLASRILAVYTAIQAISHLGYLSLWLPVESGASKPPLPSLVFSLVDLVALIAAAAFLWREADRVATWMAPPPSPGARVAGSVEIGPEILHAIAFSGLGLWILVSVLPEVLSVVSTSLALGVTELQRWRGPNGLNLLLDAVAVLAKAAIGVYLLFGGAALAAFVRRSWNLARYHPQPPAPGTEARRGS